MLLITISYDRLTHQDTAEDNVWHQITTHHYLQRNYSQADSFEEDDPIALSPKNSIIKSKFKHNKIRSAFGHVVVDLKNWKDSLDQQREKLSLTTSQTCYSVCSQGHLIFAVGGSKTRGIISHNVEFLDIRAPKWQSLPGIKQHCCRLATHRDRLCAFDRDKQCPLGALDMRAGKWLPSSFLTEVNFYPSVCSWKLSSNEMTRFDVVNAWTWTPEFVAPKGLVDDSKPILNGFRESHQHWPPYNRSIVLNYFN